MNEYTDRLRGFGGNMIQKKRQFAKHSPWFCPECEKVVNASYRAQCEICGASRPKMTEKGHKSH